MAWENAKQLFFFQKNKREYENQGNRGIAELCSQPEWGRGYGKVGRGCGRALREVCELLRRERGGWGVVLCCLSAVLKRSWVRLVGDLALRTLRGNNSHVLGGNEWYANGAKRKQNDRYRGPKKKKASTGHVTRKRMWDPQESWEPLIEVLTGLDRYMKDASKKRDENRGSAGVSAWGEKKQAENERNEIDIPRNVLRNVLGVFNEILQS